MSIKAIFEHAFKEFPITFSVIIAFMAYLLGGLFERVFIPALQKLVKRSRTEVDDLLIKALHRKLRWLFVTFSFQLSIQFLHFPASIEAILRHQLIPSLYIFILTIFIQEFTANWVQYALRSTRGQHVISTSLFSNIIRVIIISIGIVFILDVWEVSLVPLLTTFGVGGLAVALALQDTFSNFFAGVQIILSKKVRPGDYVVLDSGQEGFVQDISWRNTSILSLANNYIIIPNSKLGSSIVTNFHSGTPQLLLSVVVGVAYDSNLELVEEITKEVAKQIMLHVEGGDPAYEPFMNYHTFNVSSIDFTIRLKCLDPQYRFHIVHAFIKALHKRYREVGIQIALPTRVVHIHNLWKNEANVDN